MCIKPPIEKEIFVFLQREKIKIMPRKSYKTQKNTPITVNEPVVAYQTAVPDISFSNEWNPNVPFLYFFHLPIVISKTSCIFAIRNYANNTDVVRLKITVPVVHPVELPAGHIFYISDK